MYPKLSDFIRDVFGFYVPLPFTSFGIILAIAFVVGYYLFVLELRRKEREGLLPPVIKKINHSQKYILVKYLVSGLGGFILGYKLFGVLLNYQLFVKDAIGFMFSLVGSLTGGIIGAIGMIGYRYIHLKELKNQHFVVISPYEIIGNMSLMATVFCLIGARLFHYIEDPQIFFDNPISALTSGGLNIYGGLIFGAGYIIYFLKKNKLNVVQFGDASAPAIMIAYGIARLGCHVSGDGDWGMPNDTPKPDLLAFLPDWLWAYDYPNNALHVDLKTFYDNLGYESVLGTAWPTPIYEFVICLLFFMLLWSVRKKIIIPGVLFSIFLILNGLERFAIEMIRINPLHDFLGIQMTLAQIIATILVFLGIFGIWYFRRTRQACTKVE